MRLQCKLWSQDQFRFLVKRNAAVELVVLLSSERLEDKANQEPVDKRPGRCALLPALGVCACGRGLVSEEPEDHGGGQLEKTSRRALSLASRCSVCLDSEQLLAVAATMLVFGCLGRCKRWQERERRWRVSYMVVASLRSRSIATKQLRGSGSCG